MKKLKITMLGAGSGFVMAIAKGLLEDERFTDCMFCLMDVDRERLDLARKTVSEMMEKSTVKFRVSDTLSREEALEGADYVVTACEIKRNENWVKDIRIPMEFGVTQFKGENGGPGGMIHGIRNICLFKPILKDMERLCPDAMLMNFTNPMSILCTYFNRYSKIRNIGFCHQVHGSFGVIAEMLGMAPGDLQVISGGINHLNWLFDIRKKGSRESCMKEFLERVRSSDFWKYNQKNVPGQKFTLEVLNTFNMYPVGYDDHICEYLSFFWEESEWAEQGMHTELAGHEQRAAAKLHALKIQRLLGVEYENPPFPAEPDGAYYSENPCSVMLALESNETLYLDGAVIPNNGAIGNLPEDAILDVPAVVTGGAARSVYAGKLPPGPLEICRRQIALHEMAAQAAEEGNDSLAVQTLCLDPFVRTITQARNIWKTFRKEYADCLTTFKNSF